MKIVKIKQNIFFKDDKKQQQSRNNPPPVKKLKLTALKWRKYFLQLIFLQRVRKVSVVLAVVNNVGTALETNIVIMKLELVLKDVCQDTNFFKGITVKKVKTTVWMLTTITADWFVGRSRKHTDNFASYFDCSMYNRNINWRFENYTKNLIFSDLIDNTAIQSGRR